MKSYSNFPPRNNNIIRNSSFELCRSINGMIKQQPSDIYIKGLYTYYISYSKKKINRKLNKFKKGGKLTCTYEDSATNLYLNNKLKVVNCVTNRLVKFQYIEISSSTSKKEIISNLHGLSMKCILNICLTICNGSLPVNIYTNDPIIFELFFFLVDNFIYKDIHFKSDLLQNSCRIMIRFIACDDLYLIHKKKLPYKTHTVALKDSVDDNDHDHDNVSLSYTFSDQNVVIIDNNYNHLNSPKIFINIPRSAINKDYFSKDDLTHVYFLEPQHVVHKNIKNTLKYFNV